MDNSGKVANRRVVPRWRSMSATQAAELESVSQAGSNISPSDDLLKKLYSIWLERPTVQNAWEVVCAAQLTKNSFLAYGPIDQILKENPSASLRGFVEKLRSGREVQNSTEHTDETGSLFKEAQIQKIRKIKLRLIEEPLNSLLWLELSRMQIIMGNIKSSETAMRKALAVGDENRLALRAAARLFVHLGRPEDIYPKLRKSQLTKTDPWVQSAEIALASILGKSSVSIKYGIAAIQDKAYHPKHITELAASIATEELGHGNNRSAKRFFKQGLIVPNENTLAQALWAHKLINLDVPTDTIVSTPSAYEARADLAFENDEFKSAIANNSLWRLDEPFSAAPIIANIFIATTFLDDYKLGIDFFESGYTNNPHNTSLLNNGIVAYAVSGEHKKAREYLKRAQNLSASPKDDVYLLATKGLIEFRSGNITEGRSLYQLSCSAAVEQKKYELAFRACVHWFEEEVTARQVSQAEFENTCVLFDKHLRKLNLKSNSFTKKIWEHKKKKMTNLSKWGSVSIKASVNYFENLFKEIS